MINNWRKKNDSHIKDYSDVRCPQCGSIGILKVDTKAECDRKGCSDKDVCRLFSCSKSEYYSSSKSYNQQFWCSVCKITFTVYRRM